MTTVYPSALQDLDATRGTGTQPLNSPNHVTHHTTEDDTIEALQAKVGIDGSAVTTSHDYKLSGVTGSDKAVSKTGTETLTNKTLIEPVINAGSDATGDIYYRNSGGLFTRLPIGSSNNTLVVSGGIPAWSTSSVVTTGQGDALVGNNTDIAVGSGNKYVTQTGLQKSAECYAASTTGNDTYVVTLSPVPTSLVNGMTIRFKPDTANTGAATLNVNSLGALAIVKGLSTALSTGDILANQVCEVIYNSTGTVWELVNPASVILSTTVRKSGVATKSTTTASQTIAHSLGKTPTFVRATAYANVGTTAGYVLMASGTYNGTDTNSIFSSGSGVFSGTDVGSGSSTSVFLKLYVDDAADTRMDATITVDDTNITLSWTETGSMPMTNIFILWEAEA